MLERGMSESPPPRPSRVEVSSTPEVRANDPRTQVIGAFNRTMDRIILERDRILNKIRSEGSGFLTDHDRMIVLATQYAEEGAKRLSGGSTRLNDETADDKFEVEVEDRATGQKYTRKEGIPVGGLIKYLDGEENRLQELRRQAISEKKFDVASGFLDEMEQVRDDRRSLRHNSEKTDLYMWRDYFNPKISDDIKKAESLYTDERSGKAGLVVDEYYTKNRVGTEAYLRSKNPQIQEMGGESQDENWIRAEQDILNDRRELEIPARSTEPSDSEPLAIESFVEPEKPDIVRVTVPSTVLAPVASSSPKGEATEVPVGDRARDVLRTALGKIGSGKDRIRRFVEGLPRSDLRRVLTRLGLAAGAIAVGYLARDEKTLPLDLAARVTEPPERGVAMPESTGPSVGLAPQETQRSKTVEVAAGLKRRVEVDVPGKGKETLNVRILTGNEPDIFNVPAAPATPDNSQPPQTAISGADIKRVMENPQADDETAKMIRSYFNEETMANIRILKEEYAQFPTKGPDGEKIKPGYASLEGWYQAQLFKIITGKNFNMYSPEDKEKLEKITTNLTPYEKNWNIFVAYQLLHVSENKEVTGFLVKSDQIAGRQKITDVIVLAGNPELTKAVVPAIQYAPGSQP